VPPLSPAAGIHVQLTLADPSCVDRSHTTRLRIIQVFAAEWRTCFGSPEYVRLYVKAQKNDDCDVEAIAEAATRPTMRFVPLKAQEQLDMQSLHRVRSRLVGMRTMLMNQLFF